MNQRKKIVASSNPDELARLEGERSDRNELLADEGASRGNMFSGDAPNVMNTASTIKDLSRFGTADFGAYFVNPYNFTRTLILFVWDIILDLNTPFLLPFGGVAACRIMVRCACCGMARAGAYRQSVVGRPETTPLLKYRQMSSEYVSF